MEGEASKTTNGVGAGDNNSSVSVFQPGKRFEDKILSSTDDIPKPSGGDNELSHAADDLSLSVPGEFADTIKGERILPNSAKSIFVDPNNGDESSEECRASPNEPASQGILHDPSAQDDPNGHEILDADEFFNTTARSYMWAKADKNVPPEQLIMVLEEAVNMAIAAGRSVLDILRPGDERDTAVDHRLAVDGWVEEFQNICAAHDAFEVRVGVSGATGTGKTSLLNALLGFDELLPSGSDGAATASICLVHKNMDPAPAPRFRAVVTFKTEEEVRAWLVPIFGDLHALNSRDDVNKPKPDDDDEARAGAAYREEEGDESEDDRVPEDILDVDETGLREKLVPVEVAFGCDISALRELAVEDLLDENQFPPAAHVGEKHTIAHDNVQRFAADVKPYLDSTEILVDGIYDGGTAKPFSFWPLIARVDLYVPATTPLFEHGIVLADLPGLHDAMEERARVAKEFFKNLDITIIMAPAIRAGDDNTCARLLSDNQLLNMRLENKLNQRTFCVAASKTDDFDWRRYLKGAIAPGTMLGSKDSIFVQRSQTYDLLLQEQSRNLKYLRDMRSCDEESMAECLVMQHTGGEITQQRVGGTERATTRPR